MTAYLWDIIRSKGEKAVSPCLEHTEFLVTRRHAKFMFNYMYMSYALISISIKACILNKL